MKCILSAWRFFGLPILVAFICIKSTAAEDIITLAGCEIVTDADTPTYLNHAVKDLASYLKEITGSQVPVVSAPGKAAILSVLAGEKAARQFADEEFKSEALGKEGFRIRSLTKNGRQYLVVAGATPKGTQQAVFWLMRKIESDGKKAFVPGPVDVLSKPAFAVRGMHLNGWPFNSPYSFRRWTENEWKLYIDILAYQGVNLLYMFLKMENWDDQV